MEVDRNLVMLAPESCESKKNWLSYDFFEKTCGDSDIPKSCTRTPYKIHNLMSFAQIHIIFVLMLSHFSLPSSYVLTKK